MQTIAQAKPPNDIDHASIIDIARLAQVSPSTVSRALQDHPRISQERRAEIRALAEQLGYRPSQAARTLATGRTHTLGVVVTDVTDPFVSEVLKGAEAEARAAGYGLLFAMSNRDPQQEIEAADLLLDHQVDGLIVISSRAPHRYADLERRATRRTDTLTPVALVNNKQAGPHVYSVRADNEAGARAAVTYLRRLGHRSIAFLAGPAGGRSSQERLAGYHQGMRAGQREDMQELVLAGVGALDDGAAAMEQLLTTPEEPTAVLCYNDLAAIGLLAAASRAGVSVPHDLSVVGFDNISLSAHTSPPLTTVEQPTNEMGRSAVALCLAVLAGKQPNDMLLPVHIVMRNSAGRCRNR